MNMKLNEYVDAFSHHVGTAIQAIESAAKCYAEAITEYKDEAQKAFEERFPHVSACTWAKFRAVGNGDLMPAAMLLSNKFCTKIARMPIENQRQVLNGDSFEIFNPTTRVVERINYGAVKPRHEAILFDENNSRVRTIAEQVAYADVVAAERKSNHSDYVVHSDHLEVRCACNIGRAELESIVEEMGE